MEFTAMVFLLAVLVVALLGGFFFAWKRDQSRSDRVAEDTERLDTAAPTPTPTRHDS
jgi:UDP-N-acetylmuramyl pentapeptide phosphotransferase/UDP-N-acetylglucosamine-1-phosphate transferase